MESNHSSASNEKLYLLYQVLNVIQQLLKCKLRLECSLCFDKSWGGGGGGGGGWEDRG